MIFYVTTIIKWPTTHDDLYVVTDSRTTDTREARFSQQSDQNIMRPTFGIQTIAVYEF